jgi:hypothetical protein
MDNLSWNSATLDEVDAVVKYCSKRLRSGDPDLDSLFKYCQGVKRAGQAGLAALSKPSVSQLLRLALQQRQLPKFTELVHSAKGNVPPDFFSWVRQYYIREPGSSFAEIQQG